MGCCPSVETYKEETRPLCVEPSSSDDSETSSISVRVPSPPPFLEDDDMGYYTPEEIVSV